MSLPLKPTIVALPAGFHIEPVDGALVLARADVAAAACGAVAAAGTLFAAALRAPDHARIDSGRGALAVAAFAGARWVVRHARRGGAVARLLRDRYLRAGEPRPFRELALSRRLAARGVPTPEVVAAVVYDAGPWFVRGDVATLLVPDSVDLAAIVFGAEAEAGGAARRGEAWAAAACEAAGALVRRAHEEGLVHPDLNVRNILIQAEPSPRALLLDLDGCALRARLSGGERGRMLRRFERSWRKHERRAGRPREAELAAFRRGYGRAAS